MRRSLITVCMFLLVTTTSSAATYVIRPDRTGDFPTIQAAINACVAGDVVELTDGIFTGEGNRDVRYLGKAITVRSQSGATGACIVDCQGTPSDPHRGFCVDQGEGTDTVLEGVTVTGGWESEGGGASCVGASPTLRSCTFTNNTAGLRGGGVDVTSGSHPVFEECNFVGNEVVASASGGGAIVRHSSSASFIDCSFSHNSAPSGGGVGLFFGSSGVLSNCLFEWNEARDGGGGGAAVALSSSASFLSCAFEYNEAQTRGGGIGTGWTPIPDPTSVSIEQCVFLGNHASLQGGGLAIGYGSEAEVRESMFNANTATLAFGAGCAGFGGTATIIDCTSTGNHAPVGAAFGAGIDPSDGSTLVVSGCTIYGEGVGVPLTEPANVLFIGSSGESMTLENTIVAWCMGDAVGGAAEYTVSCCDIFANGGDWVGPVEGMLGINGNISEDPWFCNPPDDFGIYDISLCAPDHSPGTCGLIGAWPVNCLWPTSVGEGTIDTSWGAIKASFR